MKQQTSIPCGGADDHAEELGTLQQQQQQLHDDLSGCVWQPTLRPHACIISTWCLACNQATDQQDTTHSQSWSSPQSMPPTHLTTSWRLLLRSIQTLTQAPPAGAAEWMVQTVVWVIFHTGSMCRRCEMDGANGPGPGGGCRARPCSSAAGRLLRPRRAGPEARPHLPSHSCPGCAGPAQPGHPRPQPVSAGAGLWLAGGSAHGDRLLAGPRGGWVAGWACRRALGWGGWGSLNHIPFVPPDKEGAVHAWPAL